MQTPVARAVTAVVVATIVLAASAGPALGAAGFGDVGRDRYYTEAVQWMVDEGITTGVSPTCFATSRATTRGEAATFLWRAEGRPAAAGHPFTDVTAPWQQDPVSWMAENGITTGTSSTTFSPDRPVTRGELVAFLHRLAGEPAPATDHPFTDVTAPWQQDPVSWAAENGITTGTSSTTFSPDRPVTRGEAATFLHRYHGEPAVSVDPSSPTCLPWHRGGFNATPLEAAVEFAQFVGLTNPSLSGFRQGDSRSGEIEITTEGTGAAPYSTTTAFVRLDDADSWVVIGAASDAIDVSAPAPDADVDAPVITAFEHRNWAFTDVEAWPDGAGTPAATETASTGTVVTTIDVPDDVSGPATLIFVSNDSIVTGRKLAVTTLRVSIRPWS